MGNMATEVDTKTPRYFEAEVVRVEQVTKSVRDVTVLAEVSRELVPLTQAYKQVGQRATVRAAGANGAGAQVPISSAPPPVEVYEESLDRLRGDIAASDSKVQLEPVSTLTEVTLRVDSARHRALYGLEPGDKVETGPFAGMGMSFRPMQFIFGYPTVLICANGEGISSAKALIECGASDRGLCFHMREAVRLYQREEQDGSLAYADRHANWANAYHVDVHPVKRAGGAHALQDAFDADDLEYDPDATAAIVFDGGDPGFKVRAMGRARRAPREPGARERADASWVRRVANATLSPRAVAKTRADVSAQDAQRRGRQPGRHRPGHQGWRRHFPREPCGHGR